jgi:transposase
VGRSSVVGTFATLLRGRPWSANASDYFDNWASGCFLKRLLRQQTPGRRMMLVLDNARYHHAILLAPFLRRHARNLRLLFLPPYSPQLAPIERVWKLTRRLATYNRYFATLPKVLKAVNASFDGWRRPNKVLHRLCCIT